ncbi:MAG: hypothetical protein NC084_12560 [Bacteroides sp.]|nr:hypothetical protein [Eubacterium sp.]MCM1417715.1 hypothetical protein [Roseburia sp.]MCM1463525.1 hypothetical protein [Bacteroides sp.]
MVEVGQVLSLRIRLNNQGIISTTKHPYLIVDVAESDNIIEIAQLDSIAGKEYKVAMKSNKAIFYDNPTETVIDRDSYIQMDNRFLIENFKELEQYRRQPDKLSPQKLSDVLQSYREYHHTHAIDEDKIVYMDQNEILGLNN